MTSHIDSTEIKRAIDFICYLTRHLAALQKLPGHAMEVEACHKTIANLLHKFPNLRAIKQLFFGA